MSRKPRFATSEGWQDVITYRPSRGLFFFNSIIEIQIEEENHLSDEKTKAPFNLIWRILTL